MQRLPQYFMTLFGFLTMIILPNIFIASVSVSGPDSMPGPNVLYTMGGLLSFFPTVGRLGLVLVMFIWVFDWFIIGGAGDVASARVRVAVTPSVDLDEIGNLPASAVAKISQIKLLLNEIRAVGLPNEMTEDVHIVKEMDVTYLPSTVAAYTAIPKSHRSKYDDRLLDQLGILEHRTEKVLNRLVQGRVNDLSANGRFLATSFSTPNNALTALTQS